MQNTPFQIQACTISHDIETFDLLIEDMKAVFGDAWGDLHFDEVPAFLDQSVNSNIQYFIIALNDESESEADLDRIKEVIAQASKHEIKIIIATEDISPHTYDIISLWNVYQIISYPLCDISLEETLRDDPARSVAMANAQPEKSKIHHDCVIAVQGLAGGTGATTFATNLAWELASIENYSSLSVCVLDLDVQSGAIASNLNMPTSDVLYKVLLKPVHLSEELFDHGLQAYQQRLQVLTAPKEIMFPDRLSPKDIRRVLSLARARFDYVIIDMPSMFVGWSGTVLHEADVCFATAELDPRCAQNAIRFRKMLKRRGLELSKLRYVLNRSPGFFNLHATKQIKSLCDSLDAPISHRLPDAGRTVVNSNVRGVPLEGYAPKTRLRKRIQQIANNIYAVKGNIARLPVQ